MEQQKSAVDEIIMRQLEKLEERTRDMVTRQDMEALRRDVVARDSLEPQLTLLKAQIARIELDRTADKLAMDKRMDKLELDVLSRSDRLWIRLTQLVAVSGFAIALFDFLSHVKILP